MFEETVTKEIVSGAVKKDKVAFTQADLSFTASYLITL